MQHFVYKHRWEKALPDGSVEVKHSIHLNPDLVEKFVDLNREKVNPTFPDFKPAGHLEIWSVNDEIFLYLCSHDGMWIEESELKTQENSYEHSSS